MPLASALPLLAADNGGFFAIFGVFVVALAVLTFFTLRWAIRRDRTGRQEWKQRQQQRGTPPAPGR
jgi:uncharacterized membrane protein YfcA